jgi:purine-binding chemotaxis protein CheW
VREIRGWTPATVLPHSQSFVRGVINLRGAVLPIVDLAVRLGFPPAEVMGRHVIIVVQVGSQFVGLLVDAVSDILSVSESEVLPPPDVASEMAKRFVCGLLAMEGRMLSILSVDSVLPEQERSEPQ